MGRLILAEPTADRAPEDLTDEERGEMSGVSSSYPIATAIRLFPGEEALVDFFEVVGDTGSWD